MTLRGVQFALGLIDAGVCVLLEASEVFHVNDVPLLNGLFGVPKDETTADGMEVFRLIMNMTTSECPLYAHVGGH